MLKKLFLPQNKGHISNKSQSYALYGCVNSYATTYDTLLKLNLVYWCLTSHPTIFQSYMRRHRLG